MATVEAEFSRQTKGASALVWLVAATVLIFIGWAKVAPLDEIVRATGDVTAADRPQIVQNLEGGILADLSVSEGDLVEEGQVLARLRATQFETRAADLQDQIAAAEIRRLRLEAEMAGAHDVAIPATLAERSPEIAQSEVALLRARQADHDSRVAGAERMVEETARELEIMEDLLTRDIVALFEVTNARMSASDAETKLNEVVTQAGLERATVYSDTLQELATLRQNLRLAQDQLSRTVITAPMRGVVNEIGVSTIGGVIRPGEEILEIIPAGQAVQVEAQVRPSDIANVVQGQAATVKLTAYDYTIYGTIPGEVVMVSADTFRDERRPEQEAHYKVTVALDLSQLTERQRDVEIRPGMQAQVELHTGQKTVLDYLIKPLTRSREALREP